jgi:hypothetical protein
VAARVSDLAQSGLVDPEHSRFGTILARPRFESIEQIPVEVMTADDIFPALLVA